MQVFIISAPSGSGKSTLVNRLLRAHPEFVFSVSYTTRKPRGKETHGREYYFITHREFEERIGNGEFIEYARVFDRDYYGTHRRFFDQAEAEGRDVMLDIDVQGARQLRKKIPGAKSVFILAPSRQILERRLRDRGEDAEEVIQRRLARAAGEIRGFAAYDYVLVNDDLETAYRQLEAVIQGSPEAEALRSDNPEVVARVESILGSFNSAGGKEHLNV